ncbi:hypothetical protein BT69DRAFT_1351979 [Atractiella rhizophila]|nr:hypothetical protein BT69DRAFT_1351979 [Atractiella rhizophila]
MSFFGNAGGSTTNAFGSQPSSSTSAFGSAFGQSKPNAFAPAASTTSAFGSTPATTTASAFGTTPATSTFGTGPTTGTSAFGTTPASGTSAFGTTSGTSAFGSTPASGTSAFGTTPTSGTSAFGSFGATPTAAKPASAFGSFGSGLGSTSTTANPFAAKPASAFGGFGTSTTTPAAGFGTSTGLGLGATQPQQPAVAPLNKNTKYEDLPAEAKKIVDEIDAFIQGRLAIRDELKAFDFGATIQQGRDKLKEVEAQYLYTDTLHQQSTRTTADLKNTLEQNVQDMIKTINIVDGVKTPAKAVASGQVGAGFVDEYFQRKTQEFKTRLQRYHSTMEALEQQLASVSSSKSRRAGTVSPAAIGSTLQAQNQSFMLLASSIADIHEEVKHLKVDYREIYREKTGHFHDPFGVNGEADVEAGMEGLSMS